MKYLAVLLLCSLALFAQTAKKSPTSTSKIKAELVAANERIDDLQAQLALARSQNESLARTNSELTSRNDELNKGASETKKASLDVIKFNMQLMGEYQKISTSYNQLVAQYNGLLAQANSALDQSNLKLAKQQKAANALAAYTFLHPASQTVNVNFTDCTKYPAACIGR